LIREVNQYLGGVEVVQETSFGGMHTVERHIYTRAEACKLLKAISGRVDCNLSRKR